MVMDPRNTVLVDLCSSSPPTTNTRLDENCTAVQVQHGSGRSPVVTLTQELVRGKKMWTAEEEGVSLLIPPTAKRLPLRHVAADSFSGVSGRVFQTDMGLAKGRGRQAVNDRTLALPYCIYTCPPWLWFALPWIC